MLSLSVPSKTFAIGEYVALNGGPALVLSTEPRFQLLIQKSSDGFQCNFESYPILAPLMENQSDLKFHFVDPYEGHGGFGSSSALLSMLLSFSRLKRGLSLGIWDVLEELESLQKETNAAPSSYYDVLSQISGDISFIHKNNKEIETLEWGFEEAKFCLLKSSRKVATHEHLKNMKQKEWSSLKSIAEDSVESFKEQDLDVFCETLREYQLALESEGLVSSTSAEEIRWLWTQPGVLSAKGCGALLNDSYLVILEKSRASDFQHQLSKKFELFEGILSDGLRIEGEL